MDKEERLLEEVLSNVERNRMIERGEKVIVGVSGGPDSITLLHVLHRLSPRLGISLWAAHLNHGLRGSESLADEEYVRTFTADLTIPLVTARMNVREHARAQRLTTEEAARELRYEFLFRAAWTVGAAKIATGHNLDDQAETVLMRFLRGSGVDGLAGIPPTRDGIIIRPLLSVERADIERYCREHGLEPRRDSTNQDPAFVRNRIRLRLIPLLREEYNPRITDRLASIAEQMRADAEILDELASEAYQKAVRKKGGEVALSLEQFRALPLSIQRRLVRKAFQELTGSYFGLDFEGTERVRRLAERREQGGRISLPRGVEAGVDGGMIRLRHRTGDSISEAGPTCEYPLEIPGCTAAPDFGIELEARILPAGVLRWESSRPTLPDDGAEDVVRPVRVALLDYEKAGDNLRVRVRRPGDRFVPHGLKGTKKVKTFFIDAGIPRPARDRIPLVVKGDQVVWIVGWRTDDRFRVDGFTSEVLALKVRPTGDEWQFPVSPS